MMVGLDRLRQGQGDDADVGGGYHGGWRDTLSDTELEGQLAGFLARFTPEIGGVATAAIARCARACPARR